MEDKAYVNRIPAGTAIPTGTAWYPVTTASTHVVLDPFVIERINRLEADVACLNAAIALLELEVRPAGCGCSCSRRAVSKICAICG